MFSSVTQKTRFRRHAHRPPKRAMDRQPGPPGSSPDTEWGGAGRGRAERAAPGPHRGDRQTDQHAYAPPPSRRGRRGTRVGHATQRTQHRRDGGQGVTVPHQKARPSRIAREGFPHRRWATPPLQLPPPRRAGRRQTEGAPPEATQSGRGGGVCGIGKEMAL